MKPRKKRKIFWSSKYNKITFFEILATIDHNASPAFKSQEQNHTRLIVLAEVTGRKQKLIPVSLKTILRLEGVALKIDQQ